MENKNNKLNKWGFKKKRIIIIINTTKLEKLNEFQTPTDNVYTYYIFLSRGNIMKILCDGEISVRRDDPLLKYYFMDIFICVARIMEEKYEMKNNK